MAKDASTARTSDLLMSTFGLALLGEHVFQAAALAVP